MKKKFKISEKIIIFFTLILLLSSIIPITQSSDNVNADGFSKGLSYTNVVPMKKVTMVGYDKEGIIDDYAYLAAVPTAVFKDQDPQQNRLFSHPLLFYQDELEIEDKKELSLNARQGLDYFMEDWMQYSDTQLDHMTLINVNKNKINNSWKYNDLFEIKSNDPYTIAKELALNQWTYSNKAVVAVIDEDFEKPDKVINNNIEGVLSASEVKSETFTFPQLNQITPQFKNFEVPDGYQYLKAHLWYPCFYIKPNLPAGLPPVNITLPPGDPNIELFCKYNDEWMQVAASFGWNAVYGMNIENAASYIYENGPWRVAVTDVPTHNSEDYSSVSDEVHRDFKIFQFGRYGKFLEALKNNKNTFYNVDISMYPGKIVEIPDVPMFGCRNASFKLTWDNPNIKLGFSLIGPGGEEVLSVSDDTKEFQTMFLDQIGECLDRESYKLSVFVMDDVETDVKFNVEYSFKQGISEKKGDSLSSATEGAVLASQLNAPLLYIKESNIPEVTKETLLKLGVNKIILINIGGHLKTNTYDELKNIADITNNYKELKPIYDKIREITGSSDIVFSTIDPWTYWYVEERKPAGEHSGGLFIGPAAFSAAHHGTPVLLVDMHPELSSSVVWHTEFWKRMECCSGGVKALPSVSEMYLTGMRTYDFLKEYGFDQSNMEVMLTVAGKFDIGTPWDRAFLGQATPGRIFGSPTDAAYWISRSVFYPALIYENPATNPAGIELVDGSASKRAFPWWSRLGFRTIKNSGPATFVNPVLNTYLTYTHRFNERASKYWGWEYKCASGMVPAVTSTFNAIDEGAIEKYTGKGGSYFPDFSQSEVIPFYLKKGEFSNVFSTNFEITMDNLNKGVLLWMGSAHGSAGNSGTLDFWNANSKVVYESNPWRGYEWYLGSTEEPDTLTMENYGIIPMLFGNPTGKGLTGNGIMRTSIDIGLAKKPILDIIGKISSLPILNYFTPEWLQNTDDYYDGVISSVLAFKLAVEMHDGFEFDEAMDNIHSVGIVNGACLLANKYLHLSFIRHGSVFQILDPWPTSWYTTWTQFVPRNIVLGDPIGKAFYEGIKHVGILYITDPPQWWADSKQNVCMFGDPGLRPLVPGTEYSSDNYWPEEETSPLKYDEEQNINGHMPFGATSYPNQIKEKPIIPMWLLLILVIILLLIASIFFMGRKKNK